MANDDQDVLSELSDLIESLTTSGSRTLDEKLIKRVKSICKSSDENVRHLYRMVMTQLEKRHSEIRLSALQIINEIFLRSHAFRELLVDDFQKFLDLTTGVNSKSPLPQPNAVASILRNQALKAIEEWHQKYGPHYMKLALGYKYLKRVKKFNFDGSQPHTEVERIRAQDVENRRANLAEEKLNAVLTQMGDITVEIQNVITEMVNCFQLVLPSPEEFDIYPTNSSNPTTKLLDSETPSTSSGITHSSVKNDITGSLGNNEQGSFSRNELNDHGLASQSFQMIIPLNTFVEVIETADNTDVLCTLRELHRQVIDKYLPLIQKWLEVLTKNSGHNENLIQAIDLKNSLTELKYKFDKLRIHRDVDGHGKNKSDDTTDDFIDVPEKEGLEHIPESRRQEYSLDPVKDASLNTTDKDESHCDKSRKADTIMWNPHGNLSTLGDPSSRVTAITALLEKHEKKVSGKSESQSIFSCTITRPKSMESKQDLSKAGTSASQKSSETNDKRSELLKKAPVVPFGMDLYNWERNGTEAPSVSSLKHLHCYWTHPNEDTEDHCPGDIKESMKSRSIPFVGEFREIKWACRAPLPSGKLCPRKDRYKCPFHGKIIPRDAMGRPEGSASDTEESVNSRTQELDEVTRDIELATGKDLGSKKDRKGKKRKHSGLTDLKKNSNTSRARLEKIVLNKEALKRVADEADRVRKKIVDEKFGNNFNYALKPTY